MEVHLGAHGDHGDAPTEGSLEVCLPVGPDRDAGLVDEDLRRRDQLAEVFLDGRLDFLRTVAEARGCPGVADETVVLVPGLFEPLFELEIERHGRATSSTARGA